MKETAVIIGTATGIVAKSFIEKISEGVAGIFAPYQIVRLSKANYEAGVIAANQQAHVSDLQQRAAWRRHDEETQRQANMEAIAQKAAQQITEKARPEEMEKDWIVAFFDKARLIGDADMQEVWARLLADEAHSPGFYSKRTLSILFDMSKADAELFLKLCCHTVQMVGKSVPILPSGYAFTYDECAHLESLTLIQGPQSFNYYEDWLPALCCVEYHGRFLKVDFKATGQPQSPSSGYTLDVGRGVLTAFGRELTRICTTEPVPGFIDMVISHWKRESLCEVVDISTEEAEILCATVKQVQKRKEPFLAV